MKVKDLVTVGADPELFIYDQWDKKFVSAHDIVPGTKGVPCEVPLGAIQVDGVAAEFNISPANSRKEFLKNIHHVRRILTRLVEKRSHHYVLLEAPTAHFDPKYFKSLPEDVLILGCEPDYDAYTQKVNKKPETSLPIRTGAGHIHLGWTDVEEHDKDHFLDCCDLVKELDFTILRQRSAWDNDEERASLYGKPGAFRPKSYGVEYRSLSNAWLKEKWSQAFVYDAAKATTHLWLKGFKPSEGWKEYAHENNNSPVSFSNYLKKSRVPTVMDYVNEG